MFLLGAGEVPCLIASPGSGHCVMGELYRVSADDLHRMDRLERLGEADGYERIVVELERVDFDADSQEPAEVIKPITPSTPSTPIEPVRRLSAFVYVKREHAIPPGERRVGPLTEYRHDHATNFRWNGAG